MVTPAVTPLPRVKRYVSNVIDDAGALSFDLVVNSRDNAFTYGGGRVTVGKPYTDRQIEQALDDAVQRLVRGDALPRGIPQGVSPQPEPPRVLLLHLNRRNAGDR